MAKIFRKNVLNERSSGIFERQTRKRSLNGNPNLLVVNELTDKER